MGDRNLLTFPLPLVESGKRYAPASLAFEIQNLRLTPEGTLEAVRGPAPLIPDRGGGFPFTGRMHGICHAKLDNGTRDVTLVRSGDTLYQLTGWGGTLSQVEVLKTGLSSDPNGRYPDQFVEVADKIVWTNGVDAPLLFDGYILLGLGYDRAPGAPTATGPGDSGHPVFRNQRGYSHPGQIGSVGNFFTAESGALLDGRWYYYVQFQDIFGNRSPISVQSGPVTLRQELTQDLYWNDYDVYPKSHKTFGITTETGVLGGFSVKLDDLTKQFLVTDIPQGPEGTVKRILGRSVDAARGTPDPRFLVEIPDNHTRVYPDNTPDSGLGAPLLDYIPTPHFQILCAHEGCLVGIDGKRLWKSDPGFPGSFKRTSYTLIGSDGAEPTAAFSYAGKLYAATSTELFVIEEGALGMNARSLNAGTGLVGPNAFAATPYGVGVGLGLDGFWSIDGNENVVPISREIYPLFKRMSIAMLPLACAVWSPLDSELLCAVPEAGTFGNSLLLTWDGTGWKRRRYGLTIASMCVTKDWRRYVLIAGAAEEGEDVEPTVEDDACACVEPEEPPEPPEEPTEDPPDPQDPGDPPVIVDPPEPEPQDPQQ